MYGCILCVCVCVSCVNEARTDSVTASSSLRKIISFILVVNEKRYLNFFLPLSYRHTPTFWSTSKHINLIINYMCMFSAHHSNTEHQPSVDCCFQHDGSDLIGFGSLFNLVNAGPIHPSTLTYNASCYSTDIKL